MKYTNHALYRINERLNMICEQWEISKKIYENTWHIPAGRSYLIIKKLNKTVQIEDSSVVPDGVARGDIIVAVLDYIGELQITTVLLRKSASKSAEYKYINAAEFNL